MLKNLGREVRAKSHFSIRIVLAARHDTRMLK